MITSRMITSDVVNAHVERLVRLQGSDADRFIPGADVLKLMCAGHQPTNDVRHQFGSLSTEEARTATQHLRRFLPLAGMDGLPGMHKLTESLKAWDDKRCSAELLKELVDTGFRLHKTSRENRELAERVAKLRVHG